MMRYKIIISLLLLLTVLSAKAIEPSKIVVAIIDTGIDTTNTYISSSFLRDKAGKIAGWNFLGNADNSINPTSIGKESFRIMQSLHAKYSLVDSTMVLSKDEQEEYEEYLFFRRVSGIDIYESFAELLKYNYKAFNYMDSVIISQEWPRDMKISDLEKIDYSMIPDSMEVPLSQVMTECTKAYYAGKTTWDLAYDSTKEEYLLSVERLATLGKPETNPRFEIGDDPNNFDNLDYGNSNVMAEPFEHATFVASTIASTHSEAKGVNPNAKILPIRVASNGEAFDKDLYAAILYGVDKGSQIIVIPQAKEYSSYGAKLTEALTYAAKKDVLVVLAAGDKGRDVATEQAVPNIVVDGTPLNNVIRVGALGENGERFTKSNYGAVDVFFKGENISVANVDGSISHLTGTDAASASVAGAASVLRSAFPKMSAAEIIELIIELDGDLFNLQSVIDSI